MYKKIVFLFGLILLALVSLNFASAVTNVTECGTILNTSDTIYTLNQSISAWNTGDCISINATNVTLDCQGYTITYGADDGNSPYAIGNADEEVGQNNITIQNCIIYQNSSDASQNAISLVGYTNSTVFNNTITMLGGNSSCVLDEDSNCGTYGIRLGENSANANVTNNTITTLGDYSFGIFLGTNSTNADVTNNTITTFGDYSYGIFLGESSNTTVNNNTITTLGDYADGLHIDLSQNTNSTYNTITISGNLAAGIATATDCSYSLIYSNIINTSGTILSYGIGLDEDSEIMNISSNTITTSSDYGYGIHISSKNNDVSLNTITTSGDNSFGIWLEEELTTVDNNAITTTGSGGVGIFLENNLTTVYKNTITTTGSGGIGIYITGASYNNLTNNTINTTNSYAFWIDGNTTQDYNHTIANNTEQGEILYYLFNSDSETIEDQVVGGVGIASSNNITLDNLTTTGDGIVFFYTNNSVIKNSNITISGTGIWAGIELDYGYNNNITNNTIITSGLEVDGIYLTNESDSTFTKNKIYITGINASVVYIDAASNNTFYNNIFNASTVNELSESGIAHSGDTTPTDFNWNTTKTLGTNIVEKTYIGGNYWTNDANTGHSDTCTDSDGDYICDTTYIAMTNSIDYLPLTIQTNAISSCGALNTENKIYYLNQSVSANGTCFNIIANNITFNLNGFNITGNTTGYGVNISGYNDTTILDGSIYNFLSGIYISSSSGDVFNDININGSQQDAILLIGETSDNNNFTSVTVTNTNSSYHDINFSTAGIDGTWIIGITGFASYSFAGAGGKVNFKEPSFGEIVFLEAINGNGTDLSSDVDIDSNWVFVNSSSNPGLNKSANITLYSITYTDPKPQYSSDGATFTDCTASTDPACSELSFSGTTFMFNTTHFTYFQAAEAYTTPGGGGGGGGTTAVTYDEQTVGTLAAGSTKTVTFTKSATLAVTEIKVTVKNKVTNAKIRVDGGSLPSGASLPSTKGTVYKYITITKTAMTDDDVSKGVIKFKVKKEWLTEKGYGRDTVELHRYYNNKWTKLTTTRDSQDTTYYYYSAESPGFSTFAITAGKAPVTAPAAEEEETEEAEVTGEETPAEEEGAPAEEEELEEEAKSNITLIIVLIIIVIILIVVGYFFWKKKKN